jgi:hypothetical protein
MRGNKINKYFKLKTFTIIFILLAFFCLPTVATANDSQRFGWLFKRINIYKAIEHNKNRIQNSNSEDEKKRARKLLLKNYARAIDSAQGARKEKLLMEAKEDLPEWWVPFFLLAVMKYDEYKDALMYSDKNQAETFIGEAFDFAKSAKEKSRVPKKYISTCNKIIKDYERTEPFTVYGVAYNVRQNSLNLRGGSRDYSIESLPDEFIQQGLIKEGDIIKVVLKPNMVLPPGNRGSSNLTIRGYNFVSLKNRRKPGYIICGKLIKKVAGSFIVASDHNENIIVNISKTNYDFFNVGDTLKCRVFPNTNSYASSGHLSLYEIDPESFQTAGIKERKNIMRMSNP